MNSLFSSSLAQGRAAHALEAKIGRSKWGTERILNGMRGGQSWHLKTFAQLQSFTSCQTRGHEVLLLHAKGFMHSLIIFTLFSLAPSILILCAHVYECTYYLVLFFNIHLLMFWTPMKLYPHSKEERPAAQLYELEKESDGVFPERHWLRVRICYGK